MKTRLLGAGIRSFQLSGISPISVRWNVDRDRDRGGPTAAVGALKRCGVLVPGAEFDVRVDEGAIVADADVRVPQNAAALDARPAVPLVHAHVEMQVDAVALHRRGELVAQAAYLERCAWCTLETVAIHCDEGVVDPLAGHDSAVLGLGLLRR